MQLYIWPDGYYCERWDLGESLQDRSDDFVVRESDYCDNCGGLIVPEYAQPIAHCPCCSREWYK